VSYSDLLRDRRWQQKRLEVLNAAGWECQHCGSRDNAVQLHVHHVRYIRGCKPWEYDLSDLQALCEKCHDSATETLRKLDVAVDGIKQIGDMNRIDMAIGYLRTLRGLSEVEKVRLDNFEQAEGAAAAMAVAGCAHSMAEEIVERVVNGLFDACSMEVELTTPPEERGE
jgi:hypothetical protein